MIWRISTKILKSTIAAENVLIIFDDMIGDMHSNKKLNSIVSELFISGRKLHISTVFITLSKGVRLNCTYFFIMKIPSK